MDELERLTRGERLGSRPGRHAGGEWDPWLDTPPRARRRLVAAGYAHPRGLAPDELAEVVSAYSPMDHREVVTWYVRTALRALEERRRLARWERERRLCWRTGHPTYYAARVAWVQSLGYRSLWEYRQARGWEESCRSPLRT